MNEVTRLLQAAHRGDADADAALLDLVYADLRRMARARMSRERPGHTLQATALVHEAWIRLGEQRFENRAHFFQAAAEAMRRILVEQARRKRAARRGAGAEHLPLDQVDVAGNPEENSELLIIHDLLDELAEHDSRKAELVKLRYFVGLTIDEAAGVLSISSPTAKRDWRYARTWLFQKISSSRDGQASF